MNDGQLAYETKHLLNKLSVRDPERFLQVKKLRTLTVHPLFKVVKGGVEEWEVV